MKLVSLGLLLLTSFLVSSCKEEVSQEDLKKYFAGHKIGRSADYAVMKNGTDYLMTVHGYADDKDVCEELIKPYNTDSSLSVLPGVYSCVRLND